MYNNYKLSNKCNKRIDQVLGEFDGLTWFSLYDKGDEFICGEMNNYILSNYKHLSVVGWNQISDLSVMLYVE